jgi:hypothetical protein
LNVVDQDTTRWSKTARERHEQFMAESEARWREVRLAAEAREREWVQLVQAVAELQARRGFWSRVFGLR